MTHRLALLQNRLCQRGPKSQYRHASIVNGTVIMGISNQASAYNPATTNLKTPDDCNKSTQQNQKHQRRRNPSSIIRRQSLLLARRKNSGNAIGK